MTRKLLVTVAIVVIALAAPIGIKTAEAQGGAYADNGFHGERSRGGDFHDRKARISGQRISVWWNLRWL